MAPRAKHRVEAILGLGSNIGDKSQNIEKAIGLLTADGAVDLVAQSKFYRSAPWGVTDQDWFVNACIRVRTSLSPHGLLLRCHGVENVMGRVRKRHWGPRIIDVDILTYGDETVTEPDLTIPHPRITERAFVLLPLRDIAPTLSFEGQSIDSLLQQLESSDVEPL